MRVFLIKPLKKRVILCITLFLSVYSFSQTIKLTGKVADSLQRPLVYANIIAEPIENLEMRFAMTNEKGQFKLLLEKDKEYLLRVGYLGYTPKVLIFIAQKDTIQNFVLIESNEVLQEVKINAKLAVSIKKDTITYQTKYFVNGKERKLKDVLKKLPGVEVDRKGNVTVHGRRVTKVLVENKQFFTGDSKLAVNNIPADVIEEIEILDNYTDIAILKGLEDSNELAMNIKLKKDKKKFWFGDLEIGAGVTKKEVVHPSLFYYSPKRSINFIGDINNTGKKSFTFKDYLDFEGGYSKILLNPKAYFSKLNDDFSKFLTNQDFKKSQHIFGGFNITETINDKIDAIGYVIYSKSKNELETQTINNYISNNSEIIEKRVSKNNPNNQFLIAKIGIDNTEEDGTKFKATSFVKISKNKTAYSTITDFNNTIKNIATTQYVKTLNFRQDIEWYKSITDKQTLTFLVNYSFGNGNSLVNWNTNSTVFQNLIPIINDTNYNVFKDKQTKTQSFSALLKHYWTIGDFVHLYTTVGNQIYLDNYITDEYQLLSNNSINNFNSNGFGNNIDFSFVNSYAGAHLKFQTGKFLFKPGVFYHNYLREIEQLSIKKSLTKIYLLPELLIKVDVKRSEKINLKYNLKVRFPSITRLIKNYTLTNFNSIYRGNENLENELYHQLSLRYYKFSLFKKLNYNFSINYLKKNKTLKNKTQLVGINYITEPIILDNADENISFNGNMSKRLGQYNFSLTATSSFSNYLQFINNSLQRNNSTNYSFGSSIKTNFLLPIKLHLVALSSKNQIFKFS